MKTAEPTAWLNGTFLPQNELSIPVWDLGVVAGAAVSEMARTCRHRPHRLASHVHRLMRSCETLSFQIPWAEDVLIGAAESIAEHNVRLVSADDDLGLVIFVTAGANRTYFGEGLLPQPHVGIHTFRLPFELWKNSAANGVRLRIPERRHLSEQSFPVSVKTRNRLHWLLADREADQVESGSRALLRDDGGRLTETSTSCFLAVIDGVILTPRMNVLDSMSRRLAEEAAAGAGLRMERADLYPEDILRMSEAFLSSTPSVILPVCSIDGTRLPQFDSGPVFSQLRRQLERIIGLDPISQILAHGK